MSHRPAIQTLERRQMLAGTYTLIDLGEAPNRPVMSDTIAGNYYVGTDVKNGVSRAFVARLGASHTALAPLTGYVNSAAFALDGADRVYGQSFNGSQTRATLWANGVAIDLGPGVAYAGEGPYAVGAADGFSHIYEQGKQSVSLGDLFGNSFPSVPGDYASDTNGGRFHTGQSAGRAFFAHNGQMTDLTEIGGGTTGIAYAISDVGDVVVGNIDNRAFRTNGVTNVIFLPRLTNTVNVSSANDINSRGEIVGSSVVNGTPVATLWEGAQVVALADRVINLGDWSLRRADSVGANGEVYGYGVLGGKQHAFALVPGGGRLTSKGTLTVVGSGANDSISVGFKSGRIRVSINGSLTTYTPKRVKRINIDAGGGDDAVTISAGVRSVNIVGGAGNDTLAGGDNADRIYGGDGNDKLTGYGSRDILDGGAGNDTLLGGSSIDQLLGGAGEDKADFDRRENRISIESLI